MGGCGAVGYPVATMFWISWPHGALLVYQIEFAVVLAVGLLLILTTGYALVQSVLYSGQAYTAADKLTKPLWIGILFVCLLFQLMTAGAGFFSIFGLIVTIATLVFLFDVKPAVAEMQGGR